LRACHAGDARDRFTDPRVIHIVVVLRPRVEGKTHELELLAVLDPNGTRVAEPHAIGRNDVEPDVGLYAVRIEMPLRVFTHRFVVAEDLDALMLMQDARDLGIDPGNWRELPGPVGLVMRPGDPGRLVLLPLGRPAPHNCGEGGPGEGEGSNCHGGNGKRGAVDPSPLPLPSSQDPGPTSADVYRKDRRVRALNRAPRFDLRQAEFRFLLRVPSNRGRIEQNLGAE